VPVRRLCSIAVLTTLCAVAASCSSSTSPTTPSHSALGSGATIIGHVNGFSSSTSSQHHLDGSSSAGATGLTFTENASTTLTVSINGTNITSNVDGSGNFELTGVPPGDVTLKFSGAGVSASITLSGVSASSQISITVTLNGDSAKLEDRNDDHDEDEKDDGDLEGVVSSKSGTCPSLTFTVQGSTVNTDGNTTFEGIQCAQIANGTKVEVEGTRQANNNMLAKKVESD
jgi:uncharacterized protein DUF5666